MRKRALITGITGQDGSYLAELLLNMGNLADPSKAINNFGFKRSYSFNDLIEEMVKSDIAKFNPGVVNG